MFPRKDSHQKKSVADILIIPILDDVSPCFEIATRLRQGGINTEIFLSEKKSKTKFSYANKIGVPFVLIVGEAELTRGKLLLKNMDTGVQEELELDEIVRFINAKK